MTPLCIQEYDGTQRTTRVKELSYRDASFKAERKSADGGPKGIPGKGNDGNGLGQPNGLRNGSRGIR